MLLEEKVNGEEGRNSLRGQKFRLSASPAEFLTFLDWKKDSATGESVS